MGTSEELTEGLSDRGAVAVYRTRDMLIQAGRDWLAFYGYPGPRFGACGFVVGKVGLKLRGDKVTTVIIRA